ncbi:MAG: ATP-binding protein, partial [Candidatus Margulisiibacteriota bacterium]
YFKFLDLINWKGPSFIFLDEVTGIEGWAKVLKFLIDRGQFKRSVVVISGSNAVDLKRGADRLPGRRGSGREIAFLPLSFKEYLAVAHPNLYHQVEKKLSHPFRLKLSFLEKNSRELYLNLKSLNRYLENYLLCGGFPRLINEFHRDSLIPYKTYEDYLGWIRGEIAKQKREEKKGLQILAELSVTLSSKLGWDAIAKKIGGLSHHTVEDYINISELLFIGKTLYQIDLSRKRINWRKNKKFYFIDNLVYFLARGIAEKWSNYFKQSVEVLSLPKTKSQLLEQVVFNHLIRTSTNWLEPNVVFWSNSSEIDFILWEEKCLLPIEVKWQRKVGKNDFLPMVNLKFKKGIVLSQTALERYQDFLILPASIFLSMI